MKRLFGLALVLSLCAVVSRPAPVHANDCYNRCWSEDNSCRLDCAWGGYYPGCYEDCDRQYNACMANCGF